jgi:hypothetical protein
LSSPSIRLRHAAWRAVFNASQYALAFAAADLVLRRGRHRLAEDVPSAATGTLGCWRSWSPAASGSRSATAWSRPRSGCASAALGSYADRPLRQEALSNLSLLALGPLVVAAGNVSTALVPLMLVPLYTVHELARFTTEEQRKASRTT